MKFEKKQENILKYKELILKQNLEIKYEELNQYFYIKNFFYNYDIPLLNENFYEVSLEISMNIVKNMLQELEYFINVKPNSPATTSDYEILCEEIKKIEEYYLKFHKLYKQYIKLHLSKEKDTKNVIDYMIKCFKLVKKYTKFSISIQDKLIENLNLKIKEITEKKESQKIEGNMYI